MSILKSILHRWNSTNKEYDTLHPETEAAQVTDWHESVIGSLASKVLPAVVSELTTDSVMGKLMKMLLTASGVKYSIDTNGYVCLGSFFGGLIIQWRNDVRSNTAFSYPIAFPKAVTALIPIRNQGPNAWELIGTARTSLTQGIMYVHMVSGAYSDVSGQSIVALGY